MAEERERQEKEGRERAERRVKEIEADMELRVQGVMVKAEVRWKATEAAIEARGEAVTAGVRAVTAARVAVQRAWEVQQLHNQEKRTREAERRAQRAQQEEKRAREAERQLKEEQHLRKQVQQELRAEQQLRKEEGQQLLVQLRRKADEVVEQQKDMDSVMHGPQDRGRRRAWPALAEQRVLQRNSKQGGEQGAPAYWRQQLKERRVEVEQGQVQLMAAQKRIRELEGQLRLVPKAMLKRTAMPLINAKAAHSRAYKNLSYGLETRQHFIELASLNIPAPQLEEAYRRFYMQHWPHLKESEDWEVPCKDYITESAEMVGYQAEACAAHEYGEAEQMCMGMDGSTKDNFHLMNCNGRLRKCDGTTVDRLMRGPTIAPKGGGSGDAVSQKDFCEEGFKEGGDRLDEWREQCDEMGVVNHGVPEAEEVTIEKTVATINDGEATAKAAAREVLVAALKKEVGEQEWDRMSKAEQEAMLKQNKAQLACHDHVRALMPKWGMKGEVTELGEMIGTAIEDLAKVLRIDGKVSSFNYACQKEL